MTGGAIVAVAGDLHTNSTSGLCPPVFQPDSGNKWSYNKIQRFLWRCWLDYCSTVKSEAQKLGYPIVFVFNGELADSNKHTHTELISHNPADQLRLAIEVLEPALDIADYIFVTRGTLAHTGPAACLDEIVARDICATRNDNGAFSSWVLRKQIAGVTFHIAHHPPVGSYSRGWTKGGPANRAAVQIIYDYFDCGEPPPMLCVFNHTHRPEDSYDNHKVRVIVNPSFQGPTEFSYRIGGQLDLPVGGSYFICKDGEYEAKKVHKRWKLEKWTTTKLHLAETS